jgi:molybdopterin-binding protein
MAAEPVRFLTVRNAAGRLGVGYSTLKRWVLSGAVRTTRTEGGHHRIAESELERLAARQASPPRPKAAPAATDDLLGGLSARNRLRGYVEEVRVDGLLAQVRLRVGSQSLTAVITADALDALKLRRGDDAIAVIKSTEVMIATPAVPAAAPRRRARRR